MLNMQAFHKWLSSTAAPGGYQSGLARLTHISRIQLLNIASDLSWDIWHAGEATSAH
jgi:hypothetical protein